MTDMLAHASAERCGDDALTEQIKWMVTNGRVRLTPTQLMATGRQGPHAGDARRDGEPQIEAEEIIDAEEKVVIAIRMLGTRRGSGIDVKGNWLQRRDGAATERQCVLSGTPAGTRPSKPPG